MDGSGSASSGFVARLTFAAFLAPKFARPKEIAARSEEITSRRFPQPHGREIFPALEFLRQISQEFLLRRRQVDSHEIFGSTKGARPGAETSHCMAG